MSQTSTATCSPEQSTTPNFNGTFVYMVAINLHPVESFDKVTCRRIAKDEYMPAVIATSKSPTHLYEAAFPVLVHEFKNTTELESFRELLHKNIDRTIDDYKFNFRGASL
jgi:hypothetical protein